MCDVIRGKQVLEVLTHIGAPATMPEIMRVFALQYPGIPIKELRRSVKRAIGAGVRYGYLHNDDIFYYTTGEAEQMFLEEAERWPVPPPAPQKQRNKKGKAMNGDICSHILDDDDDDDSDISDDGTIDLNNTANMGVKGRKQLKRLEEEMKQVFSLFDELAQENTPTLKKKPAGRGRTKSKAKPKPQLARNSGKLKVKRKPKPKGRPKTKKESKSQVNAVKAGSKMDVQVGTTMQEKFDAEAINKRSKGRLRKPKSANSRSRSPINRRSMSWSSGA